MRWTLAEERIEGQDHFTLDAGDKIQIRKKVGGEFQDVLAVQTVPEGKRWAVTAVFRAIEIDAE